MVNRMMNRMKTGTFDYNKESYTFDFKTSLSAYEKMIFVKTVSNSLINDNGYDSIVRDLIFDFVIVDMFTNIDTSFINMKDDEGNDVNPIILIEHFLDESNVVDVVKANMEIGLLEELNHAVDLDIQYITGIHPNPLNEALAGLISTLDQKVNNVDLDSMMAMAKKFANMTEDFTVENAVNILTNGGAYNKNALEIEEAKGE